MYELDISYIYIYILYGATESHSLRFTSAFIAFGTHDSLMDWMNLFLASPFVMVSTALGLWTDLSLNHIYTFFTLAVATACTAASQSSSVNVSCIRRDMVRNFTPQHMQDFLYRCSMLRPVLSVKSIYKCVCVWQYSQNVTWYIYIIVTRLNMIYDIKRQQSFLKHTEIMQNIQNASTKFL